MAKKCGFLDLHCALGNIPGFKQGADVLDNLYKGALTGASQVLKGSPFEGITKGLTTSESGDTHRGLSQTIHGALDAAATLTGVAAIPGVGLVTQGIEDGLNFIQGVPAKVANANSPPPASPSTNALNGAMAGAPISADGANIDLAHQRGGRPQDPRNKTYTKAEWLAHAQSPLSVGGTQPG